ncbi:MAG: BON domain-containing protein [Streptosporangiaceae bacterium]|nr:BON domain-containing protein [Streptosporangiaceae bacterium]
MGKKQAKDVRIAVEDELGFDPLVDTSDVMVMNLNGDVALNGTVPSYPQYLEAAVAARRVAGVKNVHNHLEVLLPQGDYRDDPKLTTAANNALAGDVTVPDRVEATAKNGNLTLTGTVVYGSERAAAERAVAGLTGVRNIKNEIEITHDADPIDVTLHIQDALDRHALIHDDSDVAVETKGNTVTLSGHVRTWAEHDAVVDAAWMAVGVSDVYDDLHITG